MLVLSHNLIYFGRCYLNETELIDGVKNSIRRREREFFLEGQIHGRKKKLTMENLMDNEGGEFYIGLSLLVRTEGNLIGNLIGN